jgi:hypothetical protein
VWGKERKENVFVACVADERNDDPTIGVEAEQRGKEKKEDVPEERGGRSEGSRGCMEEDFQRRDRERSLIKSHDDTFLQGN